MASKDVNIVFPLTIHSLFCVICTYLATCTWSMVWGPRWPGSWGRPAWSWWSSAPAQRPCPGGWPSPGHLEQTLLLLIDIYRHTERDVGNHINLNICKCNLTFSISRVATRYLPDFSSCSTIEYIQKSQNIFHLEWFTFKRGTFTLTNTTVRLLMSWTKPGLVTFKASGNILLVATINTTMLHVSGVPTDLIVLKLNWIDFLLFDSH